MSTELGILKNTGSRKVDMSLTRYFGGKNVGACLQLTATMEDGKTGYIQLSAWDMSAIRDIFLDMVLERFTFVDVVPSEFIPEPNGEIDPRRTPDNTNEDDARLSIH